MRLLRGGMRGPLSGAALLNPWTDWWCPNCHTTDRTRPHPPNASRMHTCPGLHGLTAPLIRAGTDCKVTATAWEDWQGREMTQDGDDGRPWSSVETWRGDGSNDCAVLAPCAHGGTG